MNESYELMEKAHRQEKIEIYGPAWVEEQEKERDLAQLMKIKEEPRGHL